MKSGDGGVRTPRKNQQHPATPSAEV